MWHPPSGLTLRKHRPISGHDEPTRAVNRSVAGSKRLHRYVVGKESTVIGRQVANAALTVPGLLSAERAFSRPLSGGPSSRWRHCPLTRTYAVVGPSHYLDIRWLLIAAIVLSLPLLSALVFGKLARTPHPAAVVARLDEDPLR